MVEKGVEVFLPSQPWCFPRRCVFVGGQVHNISPVIAEWDFKRLFGDPRDEAKFKLTPKGGSLHRDQRVNVQVGASPEVSSIHH